MRSQAAQPSETTFQEQLSQQDARNLHRGAVAGAIAKARGGNLTPDLLGPAHVSSPVWATRNQTARTSTYRYEGTNNLIFKD